MDNERGVHADISKKYLYRLSYHRKQGTIFDDKRWASRISGKVGSCVVVHPKICLLIHTISVDYRERKRQRQRDRDRDRETETERDGTLSAGQLCICQLLPGYGTTLILLLLLPVLLCSATISRASSLLVFFDVIHQSSSQIADVLCAADHTSNNNTICNMKKNKKKRKGKRKMLCSFPLLKIWRLIIIIRKTVI